MSEGNNSEKSSLGRSHVGIALLAFLLGVVGVVYLAVGLSTANDNSSPNIATNSSVQTEDRTDRGVELSKQRSNGAVDHTCRTVGNEICCTTKWADPKTVRVDIKRQMTEGTYRVKVRITGDKVEYCYTSE